MQCPIVFRRLFHSNVWSTSRRQKIEREMPMGVGWCAMLWPVWLFCNNNSQSGWSSAQGYIWAALFELDNSSVWLINRSGVLVLTVDCSALAGRVCVSVAHTGAAGMSTTTGRAGPGRPAVAIFCWALYEFNLESVFIYTRVFLQRVNAGQIEIYYVKACKILSHLHRLWLHPARLEFWLS